MNVDIVEFAKDLLLEHGRSLLREIEIVRSHGSTQASRLRAAQDLHGETFESGEDTQDETLDNGDEDDK